MSPFARRTPAGQAGSGPGTTGRTFADLGRRAASGLVLVVLALLTAYLGGQAFGLFWWAASLAVLWEWQRMIGGGRPTARFGVGGIALSLAAPLAETQHLPAALGVVVLGAGAAAVLADPGRRTLAAAGVGYAAALTVSVSLLRQSFPFGFEAIAWLFAVVWGTDIMAYLGGRLIGGPKLWPRLSPSKTWAGFLIGIACGSVAGLAVAPAAGKYAAYLALGLLAGAIAQAGDLFESALKRRFGVKDSGRLIPGHGGVMDRVDGFVAAATFAAALGVARFGVATPGAGLFVW